MQLVLLNESGYKIIQSADHTTIANITIIGLMQILLGSIVWSRIILKQEIHVQDT